MDAASATGDDPPTPRAVLALFVLHASRGPLPNFERDVQQFHAFFNQPVLIYCLGQIYRRSGQQMMAWACFRAASLSGGRQADHFETGLFLSRQGWFELAENEFEQVLLCDGLAKDDYDCKAHLQLAFIAQWSRQDQAAGEHMRDMLDLLPRTDLNFDRVRAERLEMEMHWHLFRAAVARHDDAAAQKEADNLWIYSPTDPAIALDLIPWLKNQNRPGDADKITAQTLQAHPGDAYLQKQLQPTTRPAQTRPTSGAAK